MEIFGKYCNYEMHPYDGIMELTARAKELGLKIAVVSNKPDAQAKRRWNTCSEQTISTR